LQSPLCICGPLRGRIEQHILEFPPKVLGVCRGYGCWPWRDWWGTLVAGLLLGPFPSALSAAFYDAGTVPGLGEIHPVWGTKHSYGYGPFCCRGAPVHDGCPHTGSPPLCSHGAFFSFGLWPLVLVCCQGLGSLFHALAHSHGMGWSFDKGCH